MTAVVQISSLALKHIRKVPRHILDKLMAWVHFVEQEGLDEARKIPGFHDEPLRGQRKGQRSIRLSRAYRGIYRVDHTGAVEIVVVEEVSKHDY